MTSTIEALRSSMTGSVILPGDEEYDTARAIWNADIDRRPTAVARCRTSDDVAAALRFAQQEGLEVAVRGGAHSMSGNAVCEGGLMIDLSAMREVRVDPERRRRGRRRRRDLG